MPDNISRQHLKKKVLDRWENEGGKILADRRGINKNDSPGKSAGDDTAVHPKVLRPSDLKGKTIKDEQANAHTRHRRKS